MEAQVASIKDSEGRAIGPYALHSQTESKVLYNEQSWLSARPGTKAQVASNLRQTDTGKAGFIASSKNKTWKQTKVLSESDVYSV